MFAKDTDFETYLNPVFPYSFPDPFVLKFRSEYFAYCTDFWRDGKVFGVLRSRDLVNWTEIGGAMMPLETNPPFYWAPEITYANGKFYLYYSVGNEINMEIRVAVSERPDGGFVDSGKKLTTEQFAIDAHVFTDTDGQKCLFYATDFLEHSHIGTGTVVDKMLDFFTLEGNPRPVTRAKYDWQIYDANRIEKGGVRWHTVEGAFVLKRKGVYFEMFSGGNWQNITYGVSFAVTDDIENRQEWAQFSDGEKVFPILRTLPDLVIGPGHNSVVRGPNNRELFCIYHRWTEKGRVLAIDRMDFAGNRIFIEGASHTAQIAPFAPTISDYFLAEPLAATGGLTDSTSTSQNEDGIWTFAESEAICEISGRSELIYTSDAASFLCEFSVRLVENNGDDGNFGFCLKNENETSLNFSLLPAVNQAIINFGRQQIIELSADLSFSAIHLLRVEADEFRVRVSLDENLLFDEMLEKVSSQIALTVKNVKAAFSGFALTEGFEDLFDWNDTEIERHGWRKSSDEAVLFIERQELILENRSETDVFLWKGGAHENFEFAANIRLVESFGADADFGFFLSEPSAVADGLTRRFGILSNCLIDDLQPPATADGSDLRQIDNLQPSAAINDADLRQFRIIKFGEKLILQSEGKTLLETIAPKEDCRIAVFCRNSRIALEMVRLTIW